MKLTPANWEAFSDFGNRTTLGNATHCPADNVVHEAQSKFITVGYCNS